jgi:hypothetical protein
VLAGMREQLAQCDLPEHMLEREQWARQGRSLESLIPRPGIREQNLPITEVAPSFDDFVCDKQN